MKVSPINKISTNYTNLPNFKSRTTFNPVQKLIKSAAIPAFAFAALTPSLLSAQIKQNNSQEAVQYEKEFLLGNQPYTMKYINTDKNFGEDAVTDIYFVPQDSTLQSLKLENFIIYNTRDEDERFIYTEVSEPGFEENLYYELPDEINEELLNLYNGEADFFLIPGFNTYTEINL